MGLRQVTFTFIVRAENSCWADGIEKTFREQQDQAFLLRIIIDSDMASTSESVLDDEEGQWHQLIHALLQGKCNCLFIAIYYTRCKSPHSADVLCDKHLCFSKGLLKRLTSRYEEQAMESRCGRPSDFADVNEKWRKVAQGREDIHAMRQETPMKVNQCKPDRSWKTWGAIGIPKVDKSHDRCKFMHR